MVPTRKRDTKQRAHTERNEVAKSSAWMSRGELEMTVGQAIAQGWIERGQVERDVLLQARRDRADRLDQGLLDKEVRMPRRAASNVAATNTTSVPSSASRFASRVTARAPKRTCRVAPFGSVATTY